VEKGKRTFVGCSFPLGIGLRKVKEAPRNFFFNGFENFESESVNIRVQRRQSKVSIHCSGSLSESNLLKELNLFGAKELLFNMRLVTDIKGNDFANYLKLLCNMKSLEKIYFDYVPVQLLDQVGQLQKINSKLFKIRSLCHSLTCKSCHTLQNIVLKNIEGDKKNKTEEQALCSTCQTPL
jgi:hypothetical protein